jgi:adenine deaminase
MLRHTPHCGHLSPAANVSSFGVLARKKICDIAEPEIDTALDNKVRNSFNLQELTPEDFYIEENSTTCRAIKIIPGQLLTEEELVNIDWKCENGVDINRDILKLAVIERHKNTGHKGIGFICGIGLKKGAIASSVAHDSHNIIVIGTNADDMAAAANYIRKNGGNVVVVDGEIVAEMKLPIGGLMTDVSSEQIAKDNKKVRNSVYNLGLPRNIEPFMNMAFVSLPVIPSLKMTTQGLVNVEKQERVSLYV